MTSEYLHKQQVDWCRRATLARSSLHFLNIFELVRSQEMVAATHIE